MTKLAIVGCGNIAGPYAKDLKQRSNLQIVGFSDLDTARAKGFAEEHGGKAYASLEELLADPQVELVVNLTIFNAHYEVIKKSLEAGKHVYTEKPLTLVYAQAKELLELAKAKGKRLAGAPITFLGEAQQTALRLIKEGKLGPVRVAYAEVNWARIESWHPNPVPFYSVGPMLDVGVYPLTLLTAAFGPVKRVTAYATVVHPNRVTKDGTPFMLETPDYYVVNLEFPGGPVVRLTTNFYVGHHTVQRPGIEFHGDAGSLYLDNWFGADGTVKFAAYGGSYEEVEVKPAATAAIDWSRGIDDFARAIEAGKPSRVTGEQAAHIVEILEATNQSVKTGQAVELTSSFTPPELI